MVSFLSPLDWFTVAIFFGIDLVKSYDLPDCRRFDITSGIFDADLGHGFLRMEKGLLKASLFPDPTTNKRQGREINQANGFNY